MNAIAAIIIIKISLSLWQFRPIRLRDREEHKRASRESLISQKSAHMDDARRAGKGDTFPPKTLELISDRSNAKNLMLARLDRAAHLHHRFVSGLLRFRIPIFHLA